MSTMVVVVVLFLFPLRTRIANEIWLPSMNDYILDYKKTTINKKHKINLPIVVPFICQLFDFISHFLHFIVQSGNLFVIEK